MTVHYQTSSSIYIYILPIRDIISKHGLCYHIYADDIQIYASCPSTQDAVDSLMVRLEACLSDIKDWMRKHFLKLNDSKSEFALFGSSQQRRKVVIPNLMVGVTVIAPVDQVRSLGLLLDATMTMEPQIANCIKSSIYHLRNIHKVKRYLNPQALKSLIHAFITSRLDIHNATLLGLPQCQVHKLQKIQNVAARMISGTSRFEHISPVLMDLHWLPVKKRVDFKLLVITYKALHGLAPAYISNLIELHVPGRHGLRSACTPKLSERRSRRSWGDRSLMVAAPRLWNNLPHDIQHSSTLNTFKSKLKTHFMQT